VRSALEGLSPLGDLMSFVEIVIGPSTQSKSEGNVHYLLSLL
jgi:hypothetical protein